LVELPRTGGGEVVDEYDLAAELEAEWDRATRSERERVLELVRQSQRRLSDSKGRGWREELDRLLKEIDSGVQFLPTESDGTQ
jgi:hypothetical protein